MSKWILLLLILGLQSCGPRDTLAPVVESIWNPVDSTASRHIVKKGDTLYSIAFRYDADYRQLAKSNNLRSPYILSIGQVINLKQKIYRTPSPPVQLSNRKAKIVSNSKDTWRWPAKGKVASRFAPKQGKKGINISGKKGQKIYASTNGVVAYAGNGLTNYGNLIIIKHNNSFLTAYGNNARNLVAEGDHVKSGQVIAEMGVIGRKYYGVHFEIRKKGQPVNPLRYL
ncbi:MAG: peptidoglycan DD-metalloendopeptidase family protein [Legionellaceae bacterium]|nr:peptidoglycan DD-metalloendopeptidase family protein [Legionellaceae bacterium]